MKHNRIVLLLLSLVATLVLAACGTSEPQIVEVEVTREIETEVEVVKEVIVEVEKADSEGSAAEVVERVVEVEKVVEVEVGATPKGTLRHAYQIGWSTWDPTKDQRTISSNYLNPVYEGLLTESIDGKSFEPVLAESWEEDETGVTFKLRPNVTFHDGHPFNAEVAVMNFDRVKAEGIPPLKGFMKNVESAEALDELTVRYNYSQFDATVLLNLARFPGKMISPNSFPAEGESIVTPIGTGPWFLNTAESAEDNSLLIYDVNPEWWGGETSRPERLILNHIPDGSTRVNGLIAGEFDTIDYVGVATRTQLEAAGMQTYVKQGVGWGALIIDRDGAINPELADVRVRKAMQLAVNHTAYFQAIDPGFPSVQYGLPGAYAYSENITTSFDLDAAKALMAEAGNPEFTIVMPGFGPFTRRNAFLQSAWAPLGISIEEENVNGAIFPACFSGNFAVAICPINEREAKHHIENRFLETGSMNQHAVRHDEIEALYAEAANLPADQAEPIYTQIMEIADEEAITAWMGWASTPLASNPNNVTGVELRFFYPGTMKWTNTRMLDN